MEEGGRQGVDAHLDFCSCLFVLLLFAIASSSFFVAFPLLLIFFLREAER